MQFHPAFNQLHVWCVRFGVVLFLFSVVLEDEIWRLQEENDKKDETISELRDRDQLRSGLEEELRTRQGEVEELKNNNLTLEQKIQELTGES